MELSESTREAASSDPNLPPLFRVGDLLAPQVPQKVAAARLEDGVLVDLAVRLGATAVRFTAEWIVKQLRLAPSLVAELIEHLCGEGLFEQPVRNSQVKANFRLTQRGREHAQRSMEVCRYVGPAPVHLRDFAAMLRWQFANTPKVRSEHVAAALSSMVLSPEARKMAGLAISAGRSLFVYGPSGNGKSTLGRQIHKALPGDYWIPYCISVGESVIRLYDEQVHQRVDVTGDRAEYIDRRWVRIRRPLVVVGGELTLDLLDLIYSPTLRYYEAPPHLKASGGVFLVDDFGRERVSPEQLLNRFITPMEHQVDYLTLLTGQKILVPLRHVLVIATNLNPERVTDPAFLRRMGYRLYLGAPTPEQYAEIFRKYAQRVGARVTPEAIDFLLARYQAQNRELRACEPRDLIERARDICSFEDQELELTPEVLDLAWTGYFGRGLPGFQTNEAANNADPAAVQE